MSTLFENLHQQSSQMPVFQFIENAFLETVMVGGIRMLYSVVIFVFFQIRLILSGLHYVQSLQLLSPYLENSEAL